MATNDKKVQLSIFLKIISLYFYSHKIARTKGLEIYLILPKKIIPKFSGTYCASNEQYLKYEVSSTSVALENWPQF